jgi:hypothetical protein
MSDKADEKGRDYFQLAKEILQVYGVQIVRTEPVPKQEEHKEDYR